MRKERLLSTFRNEGAIYFEEVETTSASHDKKASILNHKITQFRESQIEVIANGAMNEHEKLEDILLVTYVSYIVMLEFRNKVWPYDYMSFSRRIGELWEPFCKLPFEYPLNKLSLYTPPNIEDVKNTLKTEISDLINDLNISNDQKHRLLNYYQAIWRLIDNAGNINLSLDLHFEQLEEFYDVDYKSGFSSNEKGNTNRLLLVANIYKSLPEKHNNIIFVRQKEEENNHYLQTLKRSGLWDVYCADETYAKIEEFTGFDIRRWMDNNMDWKSDILPEFRVYLESNDLIKYLAW